MSSVPDSPRMSSAQQIALEQSLLFEQQFLGHRQVLQSLACARGGFCMADGWQVGTQVIDGEFDLDAPMIRQLLMDADQRGPSMRAAPSPLQRTPAPAGPSAMERYLNPTPPSAPLRTLERVGQEVPGTVYGPGNLLGNVASATSGALQGLGERTGRRAMEDGVRAILAGRARLVTLAPGVELYNAAQGRQMPRVRLRVRGLPIATIQGMIPGSGGPVTQWRANGPGTAASLKVQGMTPQQMRQTHILAGQQRLPRALQWAGGRVGGGVLTFGPTLVLDAYASIETDLQTGQRSFNGRNFALSQARNQSGNAAGMLTGMAVTGVAVMVGGAALAASAPVLLIAFGAGMIAQVVWNASGAADMAEDLARRAME